MEAILSSPDPHYVVSVFTRPSLCFNCKMAEFTASMLMDSLVQNILATRCSTWTYGCLTLLLVKITFYDLNNLNIYYVFLCQYFLLMWSFLEICIYKNWLRHVYVPVLRLVACSPCSLPLFMCRATQAYP